MTGRGGRGGRGGGGEGQIPPFFRDVICGRPRMYISMRSMAGMVGGGGIRIREYMTHTSQR